MANLKLRFTTYKNGYFLSFEATTKNAFETTLQEKLQLSKQNFAYLNFKCFKKKRIGYNFQGKLDQRINGVLLANIYWSTSLISVFLQHASRLQIFNITFSVIYFFNFKFLTVFSFSLYAFNIYILHLLPGLSLTV